MYRFPMKRRRISLAWELEELEQALEAARMLCDASSQEQHGTEHDARIAPRVTSAVLTLIGQRLQLLIRAVHGNVAGEVLAGGHNVVVGRTVHVDGDDLLIGLGARRRSRPSRLGGSVGYCLAGRASPLVALAVLPNQPTQHQVHLIAASNDGAQ